MNCGERLIFSLRRLICKKLIPNLVEVFCATLLRIEKHIICKCKVIDFKALGVLSFTQQISGVEPVMTKALPVLCPGVLTAKIHQS